MHAAVAGVGFQINETSRVALESTFSTVTGRGNAFLWKCLYWSTLEAKNRGLVVHFIAISYTRPVLTVPDMELILKSIVKR